MLWLEKMPAIELSRDHAQIGHHVRHGLLNGRSNVESRLRPVRDDETPRRPILCAGATSDLQTLLPRDYRPLLPRPKK